MQYTDSEVQEQSQESPYLMTLVPSDIKQTSREAASVFFYQGQITNLNSRSGSSRRNKQVLSPKIREGIWR